MIWLLNVFWNVIWQIPITGQKQQQNNLSTNDKGNIVSNDIIKDNGKVDEFVVFVMEGFFDRQIRDLSFLIICNVADFFNGLFYL